MEKTNSFSTCLNRREAADYLRISTRLLDKLASTNRIARIKIGVKTVFRVSDLNDFLNSNVQSPRKED
jgi:excisionase family DNA binding protein